MNTPRFRWITRELPDLDLGKLVLITGARQVGKTTVSRTTYPSLPYHNLDAAELRDRLRQVPTTLWASTVGECILDEVQKSPEVFEKIKYAYDEKRIRRTVLLGSSQILMSRLISESLAGRVFIFELFPLMLSEFCLEATSPPQAPILLDQILSCSHLADVLSPYPPVSLSSDWDQKQAWLAHSLQWGCMPELLALSDSHKTQWHRSYEKTFLERDLGDLARLSDLEPFKKIQKLAALRSGHILNLSDFSTDAGVSFDTTKRYLEYLKRSYQAFELAPYHVNVTSSVRKTPKLHFVDVGIARQLSGYFGPATGELFESYVVSEIYKWVKTRQRPVTLTYYRTRSGLEIDLLIETQQGIFGIEIKSTPKVLAKHGSALRAFAQSSRVPWLGGLVVYPGDQLVHLDPTHDLWAMPASLLLTC